MKLKRLLTSGCLVVVLLAQTHRALGIDLFGHQPVIIESTNGVMTADLVARYANPVVNGRVLNVRTFNGAIPGPTFVASPGETLRIRLINRLPANTPVLAASGAAGGHGASGGHTAAASDPGHGGDGGHGASGFNTINLHTHGLNVSPEGNQDNVLLNLEPGEYLQYEIKIPADHPSGTFWYHPHRHGSTTPQVASGMAGNILIRGGLDTLPEIAAAKQLQLIFGEIPLYTNGPAMEVPDNAFPDAFTTPIKIFTINGLAAVESGADGQTKPVADFPRINIRPGEVQRWRMTHAGFSDFLTLTVEGHQLRLIAYDAITLPAMVTTNQVMIAPGNRADVLVVGGAPGRYLLKSLANTEQFGNAERVLAEVVVSGDPVQMALPAQLNPPVSRLPDIADSEIVRRRNITFDITGIDPGETLKFTINNKTFDINRVDETMLLNTAEEWTLSTDFLDTHPFHIHVNWFQVTKINGVPLNPPRWQDTVAIPKGGNVTIRHRFQRYPGKFVMHCHILPHEDFGMMNLVEVIDPQNLTPLQAWRNNRFNSPNDQGEGADGADPDQDGRPNLIHYAFGNGPNSRGGLPVAARASVAGTAYFATSFTRRKAPDSGVVYVYEKSANLVDWSPLDYAALQVGTPVDLGGGLEKAVVRSDTPLTGAGAEPLDFYRLRVVRYQTTGSPIPAGFP